MAQVAFNFKLNVLCAVGRLGGLHVAAEFGFHRVVAEVSDVAHHARHAQARPRQHALRIKVAAVKIGVGHDGAPRHFVERNVLRRQIGCGRHRHAVPQTRWVLQRPTQRLHAAQTAAQHSGQLRDAQAVEQPGLRVNPVLDRDNRKVGAISGARGRVGLHRPGRPKTRAQIVHADDKKFIGVQRLARPDEVVPPAFAFCHIGISARHMVAGVQCVAHQHGVAALCV